MKIIKELVLCGLVAFVSFVTFPLIAMVYDPINQNTLLSILVWVSHGLACYLLFIFIPWFNKKKVHYLDGFALASSYLVIVIVCLSRQIYFNKYLYLDALAFVASGVTVFELVFRISTASKRKKVIERIPKDVTELIEKLEIWQQKPAKDLVILLMNKDCISIQEGALATEIGERKTRMVLNDGVVLGLFDSDGKTNNKRYKLHKS